MDRFFSVFDSKKPSGATLALVAILLLTSMACVQPVQDQKRKDLDVPYVPTPRHVVDRMLEMAEVGPGDYLIDLGSGDGRIVIAAAQLGATGLGVDLDPERLEEAEENARREGVSERVQFIRQDLFETDVREATVVAMYLLTEVNRRLRPRLLEELRPGARVVSYSFDMGDWEPDASELIDGLHRVYFWIVPARVEGRWRWESSGQNFQMEVAQSYQAISVELSSEGAPLAVEHASLRGSDVDIQARSGGKQFSFSGTVRDGAINGRFEIDDGGQEIFEGSWSAARVADR